ncbi:MAG: PspC domain-containing protein, partial [Candidatus Firestonebacteria bacterium]
TIKILDMIKSHKVSVEDGKELLDAVSVKQTAEISNPGRRRIRTLGVVTLVFGAFLFLLSMIMVPLMLVSFSPITKIYQEMLQKDLDNELEQQLGEGPIENIRPSYPEDFESQFNDFKYVLMPIIIVFTVLWTISILMLIYSIGLLLLTERGRKLGIFSSVFSTTVSAILSGIGVYFLIRNHEATWILWSSLIIICTLVCTLVCIFSLISFFMLKSKNTTEAIQKEIEFRNIARNRSLSAVKNRFFRSRSNKMVLGICGGLAEYFNIDPVLTRIGAVLLALISGGVVVLVYLVCWFIIPLEPENA